MTPTLRILDTGLAGARWNIAMTAALVDAHSERAAPDTLRFHRYRPCVLLGSSQSAQSAADLDYCRRNNIEIARRVTGGGAVFMSSGMLAWDVVIGLRPFGRDLTALTRRICDGIASGLGVLGVPAQFTAPNNICVGGRKISGSSGYVHGLSAVLQGTVLIEDEVPAMAAALRIAESALHDTVSCLASVLGTPPALDTVQAGITQQLAACLGCTPTCASIDDNELRATQQRLNGGIGTDDYVMGDRCDAEAIA